MTHVRTLLSHSSKIFTLLVAVALVFTWTVQNAEATHAPADKVVAAGSTIERFGPDTEEVLLSSTFKTSKPTDLMLHFSAECSILTKLSTTGGPATTPARSETDKAYGDIRVWLELETNGVTRVVPITAQSAPPQDGSVPNSGDKAKDGITLCNRTYERTVTDNETQSDGIDGYSDYISTKAANAFNWVLLNAGSGMHTLRVKADLAQAGNGAPTPTQSCSEDSLTAQTCADAYVGNRTLIVEPAKLSNDTTIAELGTS